MSHIQIICTKPGMRRNGIEHPASAIYGKDRWSEAELDAFRADPSFIVQPVARDGVKVDGGDIEAAVEARVKIVSEELQVKFAKAVSDQVAEKLDEAVTKALKEPQEQIFALRKELEAANGKVAELTAAAEEAKTKTTPKK
ncbi:hypothetical protein AKG11_28155 [Shinella sp. SUS2]|uniref:hypothetical protein n=1 Tax=unclassified Shinella TaxID=2643062 RepID=UPI00068313F6|nr:MULTISPECIES: hypothetical protein [unclassified Shinella]KNY13612.1 hypothetical protein AKG11_28155 [Shinella sp. SUS2]KOC72505.1 hypothetical protein AKG10_27020 [Shinella sp. GWS1]